MAREKTIEGYVAMNRGEFNDLRDMTFLNSRIEAEKWKGQKIVRVEIKFFLEDD